MVRDLDLQQLVGKNLGGIYVFNTTMMPKKWFTIGMSEDDIHSRLLGYTTAYPKGNNWFVHALILYPNTWKKYFHSRSVESRIHKHFKKQRVFGYPNQKKSEWFSLDQKQQKELWTLMKQIADETGGTFTFVQEQPTINLP